MTSPIETNSSTLRYIDLEKEIWREISTLTDIRLIKEKLKSSSKKAALQLSDDFATQKAQDIKFCIRQSQEYFVSSKSASLAIKPTLIYYGLICLSTALIICKKRDKSLHSMTESHGLKDKYPTTLNSKKDFLKIAAEIGDRGTFVELINMDLSECFILPIKHKGKPDTTKDYKQIIQFGRDYPLLKEVSLLNIFQNISEIWKPTKLSLGQESLVYAGEAVLNGDLITCRIAKGINTLEAVKANFSFASFADFAESNDYYFLSLPKSEYVKCTPLTKRDVIGTHYLTADRNNPLITSDFILYYLTFFILGSLSRYKPALWRTMLEDPMQGLSTIPEILCDSAYIKLPLAFLTEFNDNFYKF